jgi:hypothetical protein
MVFFQKKIEMCLNSNFLELQISSSMELELQTSVLHNYQRQKIVLKGTIRIFASFENMEKHL